MANTTESSATDVATSTARQIKPADIKRVAEFTREPILLNDETVESLQPGSARHMAVEAALDEIEAGLEHPSQQWRRDFSLILGLERLLAEEPPTLKDGTTLNDHQVDALSGTLVAMASEIEAGDGPLSTNGNGRGGILADPEDTEEDLVPDDEEPLDWDEHEEEEEERAAADLADDPGANRRFWFEHATGAGKTVAAVGFVDASRTGGILILTHRRNLVDQFIGEISSRGYKDRLCPPLLGDADHPYGPVTVETYQWFVRNAGQISDAYSIVICDEAHTALGEKTSACIRAWTGPVFIGMTATGALIARHVADLFPTQTSRFDLAQAARRGVIAPLRCIRIPPGPGVRTIAKVPLRRGEVDQDFDQEELAKLLDQEPFNMAIADLYKSRFNHVPGIVYTAGVQHAKNVAAAFRAAGINARAVSGQTPKRELAEILAGFDRGDVDVLCNAMLLAEGWNSPRATLCMHLAPTASKRIYQQRVGRVTRRHPGKESGLVIDFVHPATTSDETIVTLHSLLDRDVYRGGAIVVGPVRRGRGRRVRVERRVLPVAAEPERRVAVLERDMWRIAVEKLNYSEQHVWAALAGSRVTQANWRRARAMLQHDQARELRRRFLLTCLQRNKDPKIRLKSLEEICNLREAEAFDDAVEVIANWPRDERRQAVKIMLKALSEKQIGRRDQAQAWVWHLADYTREIHEEYAVQRWPETKRLLGLFVNSSGRAHGRNARRIVHTAHQQERRLAVALLAAAAAHTPEANEVIHGARMRMARKPGAVARELLRNFPKGKRRKRRDDKNGKGRARERLADAEKVDETLDGAQASGNGAASETANEPEATEASTVNEETEAKESAEEADSTDGADAAEADTAEEADAANTDGEGDNNADADGETDVVDADDETDDADSDGESEDDGEEPPKAAVEAGDDASTDED